MQGSDKNLPKKPTFKLLSPPPISRTLATDYLQTLLKIQVLRLLKYGLLVQVQDVSPGLAELHHHDVRLYPLYNPEQNTSLSSMS